jgi:hypothetical protein
MAWTLDARIPLRLVGSEAELAAALAAGPKAAVLAEAAACLEALGRPAACAVALEAFDATLPHAVACACCNGRPPAAAALDRLFLARVRGKSGWFDQVVALAESAAARAQVAAALNDDAVTAARFRLAAPLAD